MIVRILSSSASFNAVNYNTGKMDQGKGELMLTSGFGSLQGLEHWRPEDYRNYLKMLVAQNKRVKGPQFHAALSAEGKSVDKHELTEIAVRWLTEMGYGNQPYLIIFHKDTANNHVHLVSCRIDRDGKKISSDFENIRAIEKLNKILSIDEKQNAEAAISKALSYRFATKAQFLMILESKGYIIKESGDKLEVIRSGHKQMEIELAEVEKRLNKDIPDLKRRSQLKALFFKYAAVYDTGLRPNTIPLPGNYSHVIKGFTSDFAAYLKEKHGLELVFHSKDGKPVYGYSVIDHAGKAVFKGGEILPLKELLVIKARENEPVRDEPTDEAEITKTAINDESKGYYSALLKAVIYNYPDLVQGLHHQGLNIIHKGNEFILADYSSRTFINVDELLNEDESAEVKRHFGQYRELENEIDRQYEYIPSVNLADDIDDEAIHGRNRRRKHHPRTNSR